MSVIDRTLEANESFARNFPHTTLGQLPATPALGLAVVTCKDTRLLVESMLGLNAGDAHIIRNAGGIVTEDVIRSLIISHHVLLTREFMIINHTGCGLLSFTDDDLRTQLQQTTGADCAAPGAFYTFTDLEQNVRAQIEKVKSHPWIPNHIPVRGFIYDIETGRLRELHD